MCISHVTFIKFDTLYDTQLDLVRSPVDEIVYTWEVRCRDTLPQTLPFLKPNHSSEEKTHTNRDFINL